MPTGKKNYLNEKKLPFCHSVGLISVPIGRFVVAFAQIKQLLLSLRFRTDKTFVAVASLSHRAKLPGGVRSPLQLTYIHAIRFNSSFVKQ
ncbi:hypothetical protein [Lysinibacillus sp. NPDC059133]|uniref:hypothetical protein n=1 Tax=Lysinibacillus sp. NPDC059133 TaxID=3346737 RepID=UPI0036C91CF3